MRYTSNQKKAHDLKRHIGVTAGAGSGKTEVLANRYLRILLESDASVREIAAITFTQKAAAELKKRVLKKIEEKTASSAGNDSLLSKLETIREEFTAAPISTIHEFCARILRQFPVRGIGSGFDVLQGIDQWLMLRDTVGSTLRSIAYRPRGDETREKLANLLRIFGRRKLESIFTKLLNHREVTNRLSDSLYRESEEQILTVWEGFISAELGQSVEEQFPIEHWLKSLKAVLKVAKGIAAIKVGDLTKQLQNAANGSAALPILSEISLLILTRAGDIAKQDFLGRGVDTTEVEADITFLTEAARYFRSYSPLADDDAFLIHVTQPLLAVYDEIHERYTNTKLQQGVLDFEDLQIEVRNLLRDDAIRRNLARQYSYIMIDEYQDTNRLQYDIIKPLVSDFETGNLFVVGDRKQSIYGFRGADVRIFGQTLTGIGAHQSGKIDDFIWEAESLQANAAEKQGDIHLPEAFRFLRNLVGFVNLVFGHVMGDGRLNEFEVAYEPLIMCRKNEVPGDVELLIGGESCARENELIARRIRHLIQSEDLVWDRNTEEPRPIQYGDIAILLRSRTRLPDIESALIQARIPYSVASGIGFYQRQEIYDICNYLQFMEDPTSDVALIGILRGPFFGISDGELFEISQYSDQGSLWERAKHYVGENSASVTISNDHSQVQDSGRRSGVQPSDFIVFACETLENHLKIRHLLPIATLIRRIVNDTGMIGTLSVGLSGGQRWANYEKLLSIAREFDKSEYSELSGFIERLNLLIEEEDREGQAAIDSSEDVVQVMTVHGAKGLEFPVVILPYLNRKFKFDPEPIIDDEIGIGFSPANPDKNYEDSLPSISGAMKTRQNHKTVAEEKRLFYVAVTRARDRLILSGSMDSNDKPGRNSWFGWLLNALELTQTPSESRIEFPVTIEALTEDSRTPISFNLPIRIFRSIEEMDLSNETPMPALTPVDFPEIRIQSLESPSANEYLSVQKLLSYSHCPTKFYLNHRLGLSAGTVLAMEEDESVAKDFEGSPIDWVVRRVLSQLRTPEDCEQDLGELINTAAHALSAMLAEDEAVLHVRRFLDSDVGKLALAAGDSFCEHEIHALLGDHVVHGIVDRLFKGANGLWQIVDYETNQFDASEIETWIDYYRPKVELNAILVHRLYPEQSVIPATIFFTSLAEACPIFLNADELDSIEQQWIKKLETLQRGNFEKNRGHCPFCPYFVDGRCLLPDPE
ncbi:MAG: UvrD-helicase domain-containing protein [Candidatus Poribacteria bacterium]|nr:UvrD-helicase domain-containing protein [Candidatus Poribacteria bacterium]MDE0505667.1 UvrD-helicase domain-containing protein [Candidatus Poribacteria bacterium]